MVQPTRQTMEKEGQVSLEKDNKFSFGCSEFEYLWDVVRRCPVAVAAVTVTRREEQVAIIPRGRYHYLDGFCLPGRCPQGGGSGGGKGAQKGDRRRVKAW